MLSPFGGGIGIHVYSVDDAISDRLLERGIHHLLLLHCGNAIESGTDNDELDVTAFNLDLNLRIGNGRADGHFDFIGLHIVCSLTVEWPGGLV